MDKFKIILGSIFSKKWGDNYSIQREDKEIQILVEKPEICHPENFQKKVLIVQRMVQFRPFSRNLKISRSMSKSSPLKEFQLMGKSFLYISTFNQNLNENCQNQQILFDFFTKLMGIIRFFSTLMGAIPTIDTL